MHLITILAFVALAVAAPAWRRSQLICLYMTSDANWEGEGLNLCQYPGKCSNKLPDGLSKQVSSAGPEQGAVCWLYSDINCGGETSQNITYPGYAYTGVIGFNDKAQSWKCEYQS